MPVSLIQNLPEGYALAFTLAGSATAALSAVAVVASVRRRHTDGLGQYVLTPAEMVEHVLRGGRVAQDLGLGALRPLARSAPDPTLAACYDALAHGATRGELEEILSRNLDRRLGLLACQSQGVAVGGLVGALAAAIGITAIVGGIAAMIVALRDPSRFGPSAGLAIFLAICGGCASLARVSLGPAATPADAANGLLCHSIVEEGVLGIASGEPLAVLRARLTAMLPPASPLPRLREAA